MKETILKLLEEKEQHDNQSRNIQGAIKALQKTCDHDMKQIDSTPHYRIYECVKCLKKETE